jgi:hypothetical protein
MAQEQKASEKAGVRGLQALQALAEDAKVGQVAALLAHRVNGGFLGSAQSDAALAVARLDMTGARKLCEDAIAADVSDDESGPLGAAAWLRDRFAKKS